jgi:hypothetical protein
MYVQKIRRFITEMSQNNMTPGYYLFMGIAFLCLGIRGFIYLITPNSISDIILGVVGGPSGMIGGILNFIHYKKSTQNKDSV